MKEKFHAVFKGPKSASIVMCEEEYGKLYYFERNRLLPFMRRRRAIGGNLQEKLKYHEKRPNYNLTTGEKGDDIRFFPFSLEDYQDDFTQMDQDVMHELESKRVECDYYLRLLVGLKQLLEEEGMMDLLKKRFVDDYDFLNKMRPLYVTVDKAPKKKK